MAEVVVTIYSHHFTVDQIKGRMFDAIVAFAKTNVQYGTIKEGHRWIRAAKCVFAAAFKDRSMFRFHINQLAEFKVHLTRWGFKDEGFVDTITVPLAEYRIVELPILPEWTDRDYQVPVIRYIAQEEGPRSRFVDLQTGKGKATVLSAKIRIPGGWSTMGEMTVGQIVIAADGTPTTVVGVFPQGVTSVYKVTFADGRSVKCCPEHLWKVFYINTVTHRRWRIVDTLEMLRLISMPNPRVYVQLIEPEVQAEKVFPIPPYTLGVMLGDGHLGLGSIQITKPDEDMFEFIREEILPGHRLSPLKQPPGKCLAYGLVKTAPREINTYVEACRNFGLAGLKSTHKFIPEEYFEGSRAQRLALLQGLMDTDGTANTLETGGAISFNSTSLVLAKGVQYLVRSLGGIASISHRQTNYDHKGERKPGLPSYDVNIRYKTPSELFRIARKRARTNDQSQYCAELKLRVKSVEFAGTEPTQCITIDHPEHLYVTDDFIVTHNSYCTMRAASEMKTLATYLFRPAYLEKWVMDIRRTYDIPFNDLMTVAGSAQLMALLQLVKNGEFTARVLLISNKTFQNWLKLYELHKDKILEMGYACTPPQFFEFVGSGLRVIDEVHQDFHLNFRIDLYTHVYRSISLSATLLTDDEQIERMHNLAYPPAERYEGPAYDKYIAVRNVFYHLQFPHKCKWVDWSSGRYSHITFEYSILKDKQMTDNYEALFARIIDSTFMKDRKEGDKAVIFCASIDMCTEMTKRFKKRYAGFSVERYVGSLNDPFENLMEKDLRFTTHGSAGTAQDIPQLTLNLMTISMRSSPATLQNLGRSRPLKDGRTPLNVFLRCDDIPQQRQYHEHHVKLLEHKAGSFRNDRIGLMV